MTTSWGGWALGPMGTVPTGLPVYIGGQDPHAEARG